MRPRHMALAAGVLAALRLTVALLLTAPRRAARLILITALLNIARLILIGTGLLIG